MKPGLPATSAGFLFLTRSPPLRHRFFRQRSVRTANPDCKEPSEGLPGMWRWDWHLLGQPGARYFEPRRGQPRSAKALSLELSDHCAESGRGTLGQCRGPRLNSLSAPCAPIATACLATTAGSKRRSQAHRDRAPQPAQSGVHLSTCRSIHQSISHQPTPALPAGAPDRPPPFLKTSGRRHPTITTGTPHSLT